MKEVGAAGKAAAKEARPATEATATGWTAVAEALSDYAKKAKDIGADIGQALVGAFQSAENAVGEFVKTGKLDFRDLVTSLLADLSKLAARRFLLGPIANALSGARRGGAGFLPASCTPAAWLTWIRPSAWSCTRLCRSAPDAFWRHGRPAP